MVVIEILLASPTQRTLNVVRSMLLKDLLLSLVGSLGMEITFSSMSETSLNTVISCILRSRKLKNAIFPEGIENIILVASK